MASTIWRLTGIDTVGADLELSALRLWGVASAVDVGAVMTCSHVPVSGSVDNLLDDNPATTCRWSAEDVHAAGFYIQWQLPSAVDASFLKLGLVQSQRAPVALRLEWLSAGRFEVFKDYLGAVTAPAPGVVTLGDEGLGSPEKGYTGVLPYRPTQSQSALVLSSEVSPLAQGLQATGSQGISKLMDVECGGQGRIYGTVASKGAPANGLLHRRVRLHRSVDGYLARETWSKTDGSYEFRDISTRYEYDVIAWDHELSFRSVVANNITPEPM